jgi:hypothetical protein
VRQGDKFCKGCGGEIPSFEDTKPMNRSERFEANLTGRFERQEKWPFWKRLQKVYTSPREAMNNIAFAPDYVGVIFILVLNAVIGTFSAAIMFQKLQFTGPYEQEIAFAANSILMILLFLVPVVLIIRWLVKSLLAYLLCDSGSSWNFEDAASVTGYSYAPSLVMSLIGVLIIWLFVPTVTIDTTNPELAIIILENQIATLSWIQIVFTLPVTLIELFWKSYLGGIGVNESTLGKCSENKAFIIFIFLGLLGILLDYYS